MSKDIAANLSRSQYEHLIESVYRGVLGRDGEPDGIRHHTNHLMVHPGVAGLADVIRDFIASEEFRRKSGSGSDYRSLRPARGAYFGDTVRHVVGIGIACHVAHIMRRWSLRAFSGPFDWIFSTPQIIHHVFADDFRFFMDRGLYKSVGVDENGRRNSRHVIYQPMLPPEQDPMFNHHDPTMDADYQHFVRSVERLRRVLKGPSPVLLVHMGWLSAGMVPAFNLLAGWLEANAPYARLDYFAMHAGSGSATPVVDLIHERGDGRHRLLEFEPVSQLSPYGFPDSIDEIMLIRHIVSRHDIELTPLVG